MQKTTTLERQSWGCGYEPPPPPNVHAVPWSPPMRSGNKTVGYSYERPTICPGYTTNLPEVHEVLAARMHWKNGQLEAYCGGPPTEELLAAIVELEVAVGQNDHYWATPAKEGGGARDR